MEDTAANTVPPSMHAKWIGRLGAAAKMTNCCGSAGKDTLDPFQTVFYNTYFDPTLGKLSPLEATCLITIGL